MLRIMYARSPESDIEDAMSDVNHHVLFKGDKSLEYFQNEENIIRAWRDINNSFASLKATQEVSINLPIEGPPGLVSRLKIFAMKCIRKTIRWYFFMVNRQQVAFNANVTHMFNEELQLTKYLMEENKYLKEQINNLLFSQLQNNKANENMLNDRTLNEKSED